MERRLLFLTVICFLIVSCDKEQVFEQPEEQEPDFPSVIDPMTRGLSYYENSVSNPTLHEDWENVTKIYLNSGVHIDAPWVVVQGNSMNIPLEYRTDIKKEDGWKMLSHTMLSYPSGEPNYMLFYNKFTGVMKGFYYNPASVANESLIWVLEANQPTAIFPANILIQGTVSSRNQYITTSNIVEDSMFDFGQLNIGWNAFSFEFAYSSTDNAPIVAIKGYHQGTASLTSGGDFSGQVVMSVPKEESGLLKKIVSGLQGVTKVGSKIIPQLTAVDKALTATGAILGQTSLYKKQTMNTIRGTTSGTINLTGSIFSRYGGTVQTTNNINLKALNGGKELGIWSLNSNPRFSYDKYTMMISESREGNDYVFRGTVSPIMDLSSHIVLSPEIASQVTRTRVIGTQFFYQKSSGFTYPTDQVTDKCHFVEKMQFVRTKNNHSEDRTKLYLYYAQNVPSLRDLYVSITVQIEYNDGSVLLSSRCFQPEFVEVDNYYRIERMLQNNDVILVWL